MIIITIIVIVAFITIYLLILNLEEVVVGECLQFAHNQLCLARSGEANTHDRSLELDQEIHEEIQSRRLGRRHRDCAHRRRRAVLYFGHYLVPVLELEFLRVDIEVVDEAL